MRVPVRLAALLLLIGPTLLTNSGLRMGGREAMAANPPSPPLAAPPLAVPPLAIPPSGQPPLRVNAPLAAHRAMYQLSLDRGHGRKQITSAQGTMGYEVVDACDGWVARQRLRMAVSNSEGETTDMESDYATWEAKDGLSFRFHVSQKTDANVTNQTDGGARLSRPGGPGEVRYRMPKDTKIDLPAGTLFPMMHTVAIINAAREGKKFLSLPLFDGTDEHGAEDSSIAITDWKPPFETKQALLNGLSNTKVRVAFFDRTSTAATPSYEVGMRYWENGVADEMKMDFGDFVMDAKLTELSPLPRRC